MIRANWFVLSCTLVLGLVACGNKPSESADADTTGANGPSREVHREGESDVIMMENDDPEMERAIQKARETYTAFVNALENSTPEHQAFTFKMSFPTPDGDGEHMWVTDVQWDGVRFSGWVNNEPLDTTAVSFGDSVSALPQELSDWMYFDGNRVVGGYTLRVMHYQRSPEAQRQFIEETGLVIPPVDF